MHMQYARFVEELLADGRQTRNGGHFLITNSYFCADVINVNDVNTKTKALLPANGDRF